MVYTRNVECIHKVITFYLKLKFTQNDVNSDGQRKRKRMTSIRIKDH